MNCPNCFEASGVGRRKYNHLCREVYFHTMSVSRFLPVDSTILGSHTMRVSRFLPVDYHLGPCQIHEKTSRVFYLIVCNRVCVNGLMPLRKLVAM